MTKESRPNPGQLQPYLNDLLQNFAADHGYYPNIMRPTRFTEKLLCRLIMDYDPYYMSYGNKLHARDFALSRRVPGLKLTQLFKVRSRLTPADFDDLPEQFVIKSAFGSGLNEIVTDKSKSDRPAICDRFNSELFVKKNGQGVTYPYNCVIVEEYLEGQSGLAAEDYKFHCFRRSGNDYKFILQVDSDRFGDHRRSFFDEEYNVISMRLGPGKPHRVRPPRAANLDTMISVAKQLARGFDYIRIDLLSVGQEIYFGEITPFHGGGMRPLIPEDMDYKLGEMWKQTLPCFAPEATAGGKGGDGPE